MMFGPTKETTRGKCPLTQKTCCEDKCAWWVSVEGVNKNTGENVKTSECVITTIPMLLIEASSNQRSTTAAVESFRNESVKRTNVTNTVLAALAQGVPTIASISPVQVQEID